MMKKLGVLFVLLGFMAASASPPALASGPASSAPATPIAKALAPEAYEPKPFLQGLRKYYKSNTKRRMGLRSLNALPLYQMELELDALSGTLKGHQDLVFENRYAEDLPDLTFRVYANADQLTQGDLRNLTIDSATVNGLPASARELDPTTFSVGLPEPLAPGARVRVGLNYTARIPRLPASTAGPMGTISPDEMLKQMTGSEAAMGYGIFGAAAGIFNLGYFYPVLATREKGAWDTKPPGRMGDMAHFDVANFLVRMTAPQNMVVVSSGIKVGEKPLGSGVQSNKETYLLGTAIRNFALQLSTRYQVVEKPFGGVKVRYFHVEEHAQGAAAALSHVGESLKVYQKLFGPYPYPELDVAEAPLLGGAGGVEYPGLVTVALALGAGPSGDPTNDLMGMLLQQTQTLEFTLAHEVAHQWWHALVGSDSNASPFLDEALANYSTVLYFEARHGKQAAADQLKLQLAMPYQLMRMFGGRDGPVDRPTRAFSNQLEYTGIVYGKGALFFHALRGLVGKKRFFASLKAYASRYSFRQASPDDLLAILTKTAGKAKKVRATYRHWIKESHGDKDIGQLDLNEMLAQMMSQMQNMQGFHNNKVQGLDPAMMQLFQQAVQQMAGGH